MLLKDELIEYMQSLGLEIHTTTKARGHQGFFLDGRIDISKQIPEERLIPTLLHEFSHYIHSKIENNVAKSGGSLKTIFDTEEDFLSELILVTNFVDSHSKCERLIKHKNVVKENIKKLDELIKKDYPNFQRSKKFKEFDKSVKNSKLRYLLKFDRVRIMPWFFGKEEILSVSNLENDFPNLKPAFVNYIRLKSLIRKQRRISNRIAKLNKYYSRPTELFARFVEGLYIDKEKTISIAPNASKRFFELLKKGYYLELSKVFEKI